MSSYSRVKAGGLKLKGGVKRSGQTKKRQAEESREVAPVASEEEEMKVQVGTGRLSTSGTTVHGFDTKFMDELVVGDAIIVTHPTTLTEETRIVKMVLSNASISISSPFSSDLSSTCSFRYISAPREVETAEMKEARLKKLKVVREDGAVGDYAGSGGTTFVYRKRKAGAVGGSNGYQIVKERLHEHKTRTELLEMRVKYKSDRHCA
ncbi:hypothetical protein CTAYLR_006811 [Chrysophaeum taylorii]|uniref:Uncharacterized protein n=1 Tax=Chrysophaeum taylorii TaxID=2483200 RepID=A0AAD7UBK9_9STRA|nr:hypothetical protein CTAYLR_006811 [Chrysophaeum taylorii]